MTRSRQTADWGSRAGLAKIVPSSVAVGSGTGSASALGTVTFTGVSSVSLNDVFSATYDNYKILFSNTSTSADATLTLRLRASGTDASGADYSYGNISWGIINGAAASFGDNAATSVWFGQLDAGTSNATTVSSMDILNPNKTLWTSFLSLTNRVDTGGSPFAEMINSRHRQNVSYTGLSIICSATNGLTGTLSIYGYTI